MILTFKNGHVAGLIYAPRAVYEIVPVGTKHMLVELDQSRFPECAGDVKSDDFPANVQNLVPEGGTDSGDRIDVLLLYTTPVKNSLGGEAQAQTFAQSAIDSANTSYLNSKIRLRLRLGTRTGNDLCRDRQLEHGAFGFPCGGRNDYSSQSI